MKIPYFCNCRVYRKISQTPGIMTIKMPNGVAYLAHNKRHLVLCMVPLLKDEACLGSASGYRNFSETVRWQPLSQICSSQSLQHKLWLSSNSFVIYVNDLNCTYPFTNGPLNNLREKHRFAKQSSFAINTWSTYSYLKNWTIVTQRCEFSTLAQLHHHVDKVLILKGFAQVHHLGETSPPLEGKTVETQFRPRSQSQPAKKSSIAYLHIFY